MKCIYCGYEDSRVIDSRPCNEGASIRRKRECISCGRRFSTYEKVEMLPVFVVKKDGRREPFDIEKVRSGVIKACEKRPVAMENVDALIGRIEKQVTQSLEREVMTHEIGEMIMRELKEIDEVAYVRFASVYRQFRDINSFMQELNTLLKENHMELSETK